MRIIEKLIYLNTAYNKKKDNMILRRKYDPNVIYEIVI